MPGLEIELIVLEYWSIAEETSTAFLGWYGDIFFRSISNCPGYAGMTINVRSPAAAEHVLGTPPGPRKAISPHPFLSQLGRRTDAMIDFDARCLHAPDLAEDVYRLPRLRAASSLSWSGVPCSRPASTSAQSCSSSGPIAAPSGT